MRITRNTSVPFKGGGKIRDLPDKYLEWIVYTLMNSDFHEYAIAAKEEIQYRKNTSTGDLETQADEFLRSHGINPKNVK